MKGTLLLILSAIAVLASAQPVDLLLNQYADGFSAYSSDISLIAESVRARYPSTVYAEESTLYRDTIVGVLMESEVKDTAVAGRHIRIPITGYRPTVKVREFDYDRLSSSIEAVNRLIREARTDRGMGLKSSSFNGDFTRSAEYHSEITLFNVLSTKVVTFAALIRDRDSTFLKGLYDTLDYWSDLRSWRRWDRDKLAKKGLEIANSLADHEARYGLQSDRVNWLELGFMTILPCLRDKEQGPSHWEPIARWTPVTLNATDGKVMMVGQLGVNYYFLSSAWAPLQLLNHIGLAVGCADPEGTFVTDFKLSRVSAGLILHTGRGQVGAFYSRETRKVKLMSTLDFQVIPGVF